MPDKFLNKYRIPSARLSNWDYSSNAAYFITICTANREHYFGEITKDEMQLSKIGEFADECWMKIPDHFPFFYLDAFVIMPNHIHGIVLIDKPYSIGSIVETGQNPIVETGHALSLQEREHKQEQEQKQPPKSISKTPHFRFRNQGKNTMSAMVGSFKSAVTKWCNENKFSFKWQSRFHDHIIMDKDEFRSIKNYIHSNPANWKEDKFYSAEL